MSIEILVNEGLGETRAAILDQGILQEIHIERAAKRGFVGNLYKGRVARALPGMQAAFIDIGLERTGFLHATDIASPAEDIRKLLNAGDEILVQVVKDPLGTKGARLTTFVSLASRYLVYTPRGNGVGVSLRIEDEIERGRLKDLLGAFSEEQLSGGYIVRTAAHGATLEALREDMIYLAKLWGRISSRFREVQGPACVYADLPLALRILRDELSASVERVLVDSPAVWARMREFAEEFIADGAARIQLYEGPRALFELHDIEGEIDHALERKVPLKSGGHLVFDQTESMTTIDVNTGAYVGHRNLEETIFRTNLEAAVALARQLRLRNLGGIIIIDFIDMNDEAHRRQVLSALEHGLAGDKVQTHIANLSPLGLVEMTRKRVRESLEHLLCRTCPACEGRGFVKTVETTCQEIFREILRQGRQFPSRELLILAHQEVVDRLLEEAAAMAELEAKVARPIRLQVEGLYEVDRFDVVLI